MKRPITASNKARRSRNRNAESIATPALSAECASYHDCIEQADICIEQARSAAALKRFKAAFGLFHTAQNLYQRAMNMGGEACTEARERLQHMSVEMAAYGELAKSRTRVTLPQTTAMPATPTVGEARGLLH